MPDDSTALDLANALFADQPHLLHVVAIGNLRSHDAIRELRSQITLFAEPVFRIEAPDRDRSAMRPHTESWFPLSGFNYATVVGGKIVGVIVRRPPVGERGREPAVRWSPKAIVLVVPAHAPFLRADREYLYELLGCYGNGVVVALDRRHHRAYDIEVAKVRAQIEQVYRRAAPDGSVRPRLIVIDAATGWGIDELARCVSEVVAPDKAGELRRVLAAGLREHAGRERSRRYRATINRIAARIALAAGAVAGAGPELLQIVAAGVVRFGALTFDVDPQPLIDVENAVAAAVTTVLDEAGPEARPLELRLITALVAVGLGVEMYCVGPENRTPSLDGIVAAAVEQVGAMLEHATANLTTLLARGDAAEESLGTLLDTLFVDVALLGSAL